MVMPTKESLKRAADKVNNKIAAAKVKAALLEKETKKRRQVAWVENIAKNLGEKMSTAAKEGKLYIEVASSSGRGASDDMWDLKFLLEKKFSDYEWEVTTHEDSLDFPEMSSLYVNWD